jgi:hypothetical protein
MESEREISDNKKYGELVLSWYAPEYLEQERDEKWVIVAGVISLSLITWSLWKGVYSLAIIVVLFSGLYFLTHRNKPKEINIALTTSGILFDKRYFPYSEMESFWVIFDPNNQVKTLNFLLKTGVFREITLQLSNQDPMEVRSFLSAHVFEMEGRTESLIEKVIRILKL